VSKENLDIVRRQFELINQRRRTVAPGVWSEDAVLIVHERTPDSGTHVRREAIARWFESWFSQFRDDYSFELEDVREVGDAVVAVSQHRGTGRASGINVEATSASVFWVSLTGSWSAGSSSGMTSRVPCVQPPAGARVEQAVGCRLTDVWGRGLPRALVRERERLRPWPGLWRGW
jgi:ketosteroid isomerase-like protein